MRPVNILLNTEQIQDDDIKELNNIFVQNFSHDASTLLQYKHNVFKNYPKFKLVWVKNGYCNQDNPNGHKIDCAVLVLNPCTDNQEPTFSDKVYNFLNDPEITFNKKIPLVILCISVPYPSNDVRGEPGINTYPDVREVIDIRKLMAYSNRFIHFMYSEDSEDSYRSCITRIASIGIVLSTTFGVKSLDDKSYNFVCDQVLTQKYQSNYGLEKQKNIAHLISKTDVAWAINKIDNDFPDEKIFQLFSEKDKCRKCVDHVRISPECPATNRLKCPNCSMQTPLMIAARHTKTAVLASFMNFYTSNIDMTELNHKECKNKDDIKKDCVNKCNVCTIKHLLHEEDSRGRNLTYYIVTAEEKALGSYGTILQLEKDFHIRQKQINLTNIEIAEEKEDRDYLRLQTCVQKHVGTSSHASQVLSLLESTRQPKRTSLILKVAYALLCVYIFQLGLYIMDVFTDARVADNYYQGWISNNSSGTICHLNSTGNGVRLTEYPDCLTNMWKFLYTTIFMVLPSLFYLIELLRHQKSISDEYFKKYSKLPKWALVSIGVIIFPLLTPVWPLILFIWKTSPLAKYHLTRGTARRKYFERFEKISLIILVVHLIEVSIESSFMAILQWYTVMPQMLSDLHGYFVGNEETESNLSLSKTSFLFSFLSLAWGFTSYSAEQKDGALDLTWNPLGRLVLFLSNLLLIFSRINNLVLFMYYWGPGEFKPGMFFILGHILLMMGVHYFTLKNRENVWMDVGSMDKVDNAESMKGRQNCFTYCIKLFYVCLLNGLANIFINNFINLSFKRFKHIGTKKRKTFYRQSCGDCLFFIQNVVMVSLGLTVDVYPLDNSKTAALLGCAILICHLAGLLVKVIYYKYFHIWKDLTPRVTTHGMKRGLEETHIKLSNNIVKKKENSSKPYLDLNNEIPLESIDAHVTGKHQTDKTDSTVTDSRNLSNKFTRKCFRVEGKSEKRSEARNRHSLWF